MKWTCLAVALFCLAPVAGRAAEPSPARDPAPVRTTPFPDVPKEHWAYDAVEQLRKLGILRGYPPPPAPKAGPPNRPVKAVPRSSSLEWRGILRGYPASKAPELHGVPAFADRPTSNSR